MYKKLAFTVLLLSIGLRGYCQMHKLTVNIVDSINLTQPLFFKNSFTNQQACAAYLPLILTQLQAKGYIAASMDSLVEQKKETTAYLYLGKKYSWKKISIPDEVKLVSSQIGINYLIDTLLNYYQNNGYPFAQLKFDSISILNDEITGKLNIDKGILYKLDSINIIGNASISYDFLYKYLGIQKNSIYNKTLLISIDEKLNLLNYLQVSKPTDLLLLNDGFILNLYLQQKKVNRFDIIFGLLPNNNQTNGKLLFTIDANVGLVNSFGKGEILQFMWQQIQPQSPRIDLSFAMPYIFNTPAQLNFKFNLYKRDSAFLNLNTQIGLGYTINPTSKFNVFLNQFSSRIISPDTISIIATKKLPNVLDVNITNLGFDYQLQKNKRQSKKTFELRLTTSFGQKIIKENTTITSLKTNNFNYKSLFDSINLSSYQLKAQVMMAKYFYFKKNSVVKVQFNAATIQSPQILQNEQFQIGGFKLLRGFDEENIFTNQYVVSAAEYRLLLNPTSYFYVFNDWGFTQNKAINQNYQFVSGGLGLALQTKQGILNFCIANGKRNDLPFNFRESKIHIGLVNNF
jgi:hypothetical protein